MQHIPACGSLRNLLLTISYDGKEFHGWQIQQNAMTVQEAFQTALSKIIGNDFDVKGCSRTDSGVHANMYCISLKTEHPIKPERLKAALNRWLPLSIAVLDCKEVAPDFTPAIPAQARNISTKSGTARCEIRFLTDTHFITDTKLTKICSTKPLRHMSADTISLPFARLITVKKGI